MTDATKAVFLSYARDDLAAARRIAEALRASGIEVWFDENELRGGDVWDAKIRRQIDACALFIPIISTHTQQRDKGYFRLEWKLAVDETALLAEGVPFIAPVVIDDTREADARVPAEFMKVQWTRLAGALPTPEFVAQIGRLLRGEVPTAVQRNAVRTSVPAASTSAGAGVPRWGWALAGVVILGLAGFFALRQQPAATPAAGPAPTPAAATPSGSRDASSIAVLAFADLSEGGTSEYFSDGVSEELLNVLAQVPGLRVAARTSSFYFKDKSLPIPEIAQKLDVAYVVEGSVQRSGNRVKITAQLIKSDGFHVWSDTFVRELKDVFAVQDEIAGLIAQNLQLQIGTGPAVKAVPTDERAIDLYMRAQQDMRTRTKEGLASAEKSLREALQIDPQFARAHAALANVLTLRWNSEDKIGMYSQRTSPRIAEVRAEVDRALALDPNLAEGHTALGSLHLEEWKFPEAIAQFRRAIGLNPNDATAHQWLARALSSDGRNDEAIAELQIAAKLDPLSHRIQDNLSGALANARRYEEALVVIDRALAIMPESDQALAFKAHYLDMLGKHSDAVVNARRAVQLDSFWQDWMYGVFVRAGKQSEADAWPATGHGQVSAGTRDLALGRIDQAVAELDASQFNWRDVGGLLYGRDFDPMRSDPRFDAFVASLGLAEAYARARAERSAHGQ